MSISKKIKIILMLLSLSLTMCFMSDTYSRYIANTSGDVVVQLAKWQILVNNEDITKGESKSIDLQPVVIKNDYVADDTFAPSSEGYFDIAIDPSNVNVSFDYTVSLEVLNKDMPDLMITQYAYLDPNGVEGEKNNIDNTNNVNGLIKDAIKKEVLYNKEKPFEAFTIRIYFEWYEGEDEKQDDVADTAIGVNAANSSVQPINNTEEPDEEGTVEDVNPEEVEVGKLKIKASITFKQLLQPEKVEEEPTVE